MCHSASALNRSLQPFNSKVTETLSSTGVVPTRETVRTANTSPVRDLAKLYLYWQRNAASRLGCLVNSLLGTGLCWHWSSWDRISIGYERTVARWPVLSPHDSRSAAASLTGCNVLFRDCGRSDPASIALCACVTLLIYPRIRRIQQYLLHILMPTKGRC